MKDSLAQYIAYGKVCSQTLDSKRELYNWIILGLDEFRGHMDGFISHWAHMWATIPQGASPSGLILTWPSNPFDEGLYGLFASLNGLYK